MPIGEAVRTYHSRSHPFLPPRTPRLTSSISPPPPFPPNS